MNKFIPINKPLLTKKDINSVSNTLKSGWISSEGPGIKIFEKNFSKFIGHKYSVAVSSGTAALDIAVKSLNLKKNDEIIIPNFTIISNALAAIKLGLKIKLVDCDLKNWNMNIQPSAHTTMHEGIHKGWRPPKAAATLCGGGAKRRLLYGWVCGRPG